MTKKDTLFACEEKVIYTKDLTTLIKEVSGMRKTTNLECINNLINDVSISSYGSLTIHEIQRYGFTKAAATRLLSGIQLALKLQEISLPERYQISSPSDAAELFMYLQHDNQEKLVVAALNVKNEVLAKKVIFVGSLNSSIVHPREIMNFALKHSAASIIIAHQHPSGNPEPSSEDVQVTQRLSEAGAIIGIELLDHIIVGHHKYISLKEKGYV